MQEVPQTDSLAAQRSPRRAAGERVTWDIPVNRPSDGGFMLLGGLFHLPEGPSISGFLIGGAKDMTRNLMEDGVPHEPFVGCDAMKLVVETREGQGGLDRLDHFVRHLLA